MDASPRRAWIPCHALLYPYMGWHRLVWASIGLLFSFGTVLFAKDWSLLRATLSHYLLMLFGFLPLATLGGWFPIQISFYISVIIEFSLVYLVIWAVSYRIYKKKVEEINQQLQGKA